MCVTQNQDLVCIALLQMDVPLQTVANNLLSFAATTSPVPRLLSLQVPGKVTYHSLMPCKVHDTFLHTCPHELSRFTNTPSYSIMQVWVQAVQ